MAHRIATLAHRFPRRLLLACLLATAGLALLAGGVPDRLALGGGEVTGSESDDAATALSAELGAEAEPAYLLVLQAAEPISPATLQVAVETLMLQAETIAEVGLVVEGGRSPDGQTTTLGIHLSLGLDPEQVRDVGTTLRGELDPGPLQLLVGGATATAEAAREQALDDATGLGLLALPVIVLILVGSVGLRFGAAALLGAALAATAAVAALGPVGSTADLNVIAVAAAAITASILGLEAAALLLFRYREESATLGAGPEALEYSLNTVLNSAGLGMVGAGLTGAALFIVPIDFAHSIGAGVLLAAVLGPALALLPAAAALTLRADSEVGSALPLVADGERAQSAPRAFRLIASIARSRWRTRVALILPLAAAAGLALPVLDSESIGMSPTELPDGAEARQAEAVLAGSFGVGAAGPLLVVSEGPADAPTMTLYRDEIFQLDDVAEVGRGADAEELSAFEVTADARPQSLAGQAVATSVRSVAAPTVRRVTGPGARVLDAGTTLGSDLPLVALIAILGSAALWSLRFRAAFGPLIALAAAVAPLTGIGAMLLVFSEGRLTGLLDYTPAGAPHLESFVLVSAVLTAIALSRGAALATALGEERALGGGAVGSVARSSVLTLMPAAVATLCGIALVGVWGGADLVAGKEIAVGVGVGLLVDLLLVRLFLAPALARMSMGRSAEEVPAA